MTNPLKVHLTPDEYTALFKVSQQELRTPSDQARHILRTELTRRGALQTFLNESVSSKQCEEPDHA